MPFTYRSPRPALNVNCVVLSWDPNEGIKVLLIQRRQSPFRNSWALIGSTVAMEDTLEDTARESLKEQTGFKELYLEQLRTFDRVDRDPRDRVISMVFYAMVPSYQELFKTSEEPRRREWFLMTKLPRMAFDHAEIVQYANQQLIHKIRQDPIAFGLLPNWFTLSQVQQLYEAILGVELDKRNFRKKLLAMGIFTQTDHQEEGVKHRPSKLYRLDRRKYRAMIRSGAFFEL
jgi:8-oxo-dGTP diphosphatase